VTLAEMLRAKGYVTGASISNSVIYSAHTNFEKGFEYFAGTRRHFEVPLSLPGTPFQERVWTVLCSIGYGERISYLEESRRVGDEKAIRAVAPVLNCTSANA